MNNTLSIEEQLRQIIENKQIYPVYQPIVSLKNGKILGYEALSRISLDACSFNVEEMFNYAKEFHCLWNLEYICRKKAIREVKNQIGKTKIFLNVDPNILNDERFQAGMTLSYLKRYNISPDNIVFEICERTDIQSVSSFQNVVMRSKIMRLQLMISEKGMQILAASFSSIPNM